MKVRLNICVVSDKGSHIRGDVVEMPEGSAERYISLGYAERVVADDELPANVAVEIAAVAAESETATLKRKGGRKARG